MTTNNETEQVEQKALYAFRNIQNRTAHVVSQLLKVVSILLNEQSEELTLQGGAITRARLTLPNLTITDIEENTNHWEFHIPENAAVLAMLWRLFGENYPLVEKDIPNMLKILKYKDKLVQAAFKEQTGEEIQSIFKKKAKAKTASDSSMSPVMEDLIVKLEWHFIRRGETLFRQGDKGDCVYIVADGLFQVVMESEEGEMVLAEIGRNELIGEISLVTDEPRSASVYAIRDSQVCRLTKEDFDSLVERHDSLRSLIVQQIIDRLRRDESQRRPRFTHPRVITLVPISPGINNFGKEFTRLLGYQTEVMYLNREQVERNVPPAMASALDDDSHEYEFNAWLEDKEVQNEFVVYEADYEYTRWTERCLQRADRILLVGRADEDPGLVETEEKIKTFNDNHLIATQELVLLHEADKKPNGTINWLQNRSVNRHHHIHIGNGPDFARMFRLWFGMGTGLVLGGGGVRGPAHGGAYHVIEKNKIHIDAIGGTSVGAIAGSIFAMGFTAAESLSIIREHLYKNDVLMDITLPIVGINAARKIMHGFDTVYGDLQIEDLPIPFFCLSTNITKAQLMVHTTGSLAKYVRASTSLPAIYPPVVDDDYSLLVDGGVMNNLPINEMLHFMRGGKVIAVDLGKQSPPVTEYQYGNHVSGWRVLSNILNPFQKEQTAPNILETITRTSSLMSQINAVNFHNLADVVIRPNLEGSDTLDTGDPDVIYQQGFIAAKEALANWEQ